jgi:hypothetical protein
MAFGGAEMEDGMGSRSGDESGWPSGTPGGERDARSRGPAGLWPATQAPHTCPARGLGPSVRVWSRRGRSGCGGLLALGASGCAERREGRDAARTGPEGRWRTRPTHSPNRPFTQSGVQNNLQNINSKPNHRCPMRWTCGRLGSQGDHNGHGPSHQPHEHRGRDRSAVYQRISRASASRWQSTGL